MKTYRFCILTIILLLLLCTEVTLNAVTYEQLPNRPSWRGFYYCLDMADYPQLLLSNMPYQVLQGYIVADSIIRALPTITYKWDPIENFNLRSDTAKYLYKHWYYMNEYDPLRFFSFTRKKYPEAKNRPTGLFSNMEGRMVADYSTSLYVLVDYILHIHVNNTVWIDTSDATPLEISRPDSNGNVVKDTAIHVTTKTIAFCKVLDTLKGGTFPSLESAIFYNGKLPNNSSSVINNIYSMPQQTDIVFSYRDDWSRSTIRGSGYTPLYDSNGEKWIKPNREYIVFLGFMGIDGIGSWDTVGSVHKIYYCITPYYGAGSFNMYPVENGNVIDEANALGFGTVVPINVFKQCIRNKINEIKNYGE